MSGPEPAKYRLRDLTAWIEVKYLQWVNNGEEDIAVILDVQNQEERQRILAEQHALQPGIPPLACMVVEEPLTVR